MKRMHKHGRVTAVLLSLTMLSTNPAAVYAADYVEQTPGNQLQTICILNNGGDWTTESWGGQNIVPENSWRTMLLGDYYENGVLSFEVKNDNAKTVEFNIALSSKKHGIQEKIYWTDMEQYADLSAGSEWKSYTLPIKDVVDAHPDSDFDLDSFWLVFVNGIPSGNTLTFRNVKISSADEERQYPMIKVNQVGYYRNSAKTIRVSYFEKFGSLNGKPYEVVNADTGEVVLTDTLPDAVFDEKFSGEMLHTFQIDQLTQTGRYFIRIPDTGMNAAAMTPYDKANGLEVDTLLSPTFTVEDAVYDDLLRELTKYYYYQRQGTAIEAEYAGDFARENLHPNDVAVKKWSDRNNPNAETFDVSGGWYDAGDYGKYVTPGANSVTDLLLAYQMNPQIFQQLDMHIPETDPKHPQYVDAPGILAEVKYELDMLLKLEHSSKDGSFYTAANYNSEDNTIYIEDTLYKTSDYQSGDGEKDLRCHLATADMAAALAQAYVVYRDFPVYADFAEECLATALRSWEWMNDPSNKHNTSIGAANRTYTFNAANFEQSRFHAAGALYRALTCKGADASEFEDYLIANCETESVKNCFTGASINYGHSGRAFLGFFQYLYGNPAPAAEMTKVFGEYETWRARMMRYQLWGLEMPLWGFWWGSNKHIAQLSLTMMLGDLVTYGEVREDAQASIVSHFDYMLGSNPLSFSYVSGFGENCVENIFSSIYSKDAKLTPYRCPAGYFTEGTNDNNNPHLSKFTGKCYIDSDSEWTTNENTIYGNAAMIFLTSYVMAMNAPERVRGDANADGTFNVSDIVLVQKWLLCVPDEKVKDWQTCDFHEDGRLDAFDLALMKRELLQ